MIDICLIIEEQIKKVNAPTFIYKIAHGKEAKSFLSGRSSHEQREIDGIMIDVGIPEGVIGELNSIAKIEMRASCQGESKTKPAFIIFRAKSGDPEKIVEKLNKNKDISAGYDVGNGGLTRIGVTNKTIFGESDKAKKWWAALPAKIKKAI